MVQPRKLLVFTSKMVVEHGLTNRSCVLTSKHGGCTWFNQQKVVVWSITMVILQASKVVPLCFTDKTSDFTDRTDGVKGLNIG
jgi:hypothetical protein